MYRDCFNEDVKVGYSQFGLVHFTSLKGVIYDVESDLLLMHWNDNEITRHPNASNDYDFILFENGDEITFNRQ